MLTRDLESPEDARPVLELGLITEEDGLLSFSLPIFTHWFAAQSLAQLGPDIREIPTDRRRLDRWRGALTVAVGSLLEQHVSRIMSAIVEHDPALAACLITEELDTWRSGELPHLPALHECGRRLVDSAERWALGLGTLAREFRPFLRQPHSQLGVAGNASTLVTSWNLSESSPPVVELVDARQVGIREFELVRNSSWSSASFPGLAVAWSLDYFVGAIDRAIENRRFPMTKRLLLERAWKVAGDLDRWTTIQRESLSLANFRNLFAQYSPNTPIQTGTAHYEVKSLNDLVDELESLGFTEIRDPWPSKDVPNIRGRWIWSQYSAERMLERATEVYSAALEAYELALPPCWRQLGQD